MTDPIPHEVYELIKAFCSAGKTGQIVLDASEGRILAWKISESGRVGSRRIDKSALMKIDWR